MSQTDVIEAAEQLNFDLGDDEEYEEEYEEAYEEEYEEQEAPAEETFWKQENLRL